MIRSEKAEASLTAIHTVFYLCRGRVVQKPKLMVQILDWAELLPLLFLGTKDHTEYFRDVLVEIAERDPEFGVALSRYDENDVGPVIP